jgi:DHA2 family methylenomycin A resistance protein-like MFS transporter
MSQQASTPTRPGLVLAFVCAGIFMVYLDSTIVNIALPQISADLGGGVTKLQWVVDVYALAFASLLLTSGALGDILGRRRVFLVGLVGFTAASAWCALSGSIEMLLTARAVQGAVGAGLIPISLAFVTQLYTEPAKRAKMIGLWAGLGGLALAGGPVIGGALLENYSWESIFWVNIPLGIISVIALYLLLPKTQPKVVQHLDPIGQLLLIIAVGVLTYGLIEGNSRGWSDSLIIGSFVVSAVSLVVFVVWQARSSRPLIPETFFRNRTLAAACAVNFLGLFGLFGAIFLMSLYLQSINGLTAIEAGVRFLALTLAIMVASGLAPLVAARLGARITIVLGSLFSAGGLIGLYGLEVADGFGAYWWAFVLIGIGVSLCGAPATIALLASVPDNRAGTASGVSNTFRQVGGVFGVAVGGAVVLRHMRVSLTPDVEALPIPQAAKDQMLDAIGRGDSSAMGNLPQAIRATISSRVSAEFVVGMHWAFVVAAVGALLGGVVALLFFRTPETAAAPQDELTPEREVVVAE